MWPHFHLLGVEISSSIVFHLLAVAASIGVAWWRHPETKAHSAFAILGTTTLAFWGAVLFPFSSGRTYYGALFGGIAAVYFVLRRFTPEQRLQRWNSAALFGAMTYGILRVGCFAGGCCWGHVTDVPWAVTFTTEASVMPFQGLPVHPVQLYDAALGFGLFAVLWKIEQPGRNLVPWFLGLYACGRFVTEMFRGDLVRGADVAFGLSTSQVISLAIICLILSHRALARFATASTHLKIEKDPWRNHVTH